MNIANDFLLSFRICFLHTFLCTYIVTSTFLYYLFLSLSSSKSIFINLILIFLDKKSEEKLLQIIFMN